MGSDKFQMMRFSDSEEMSLALKHTNVTAMQVNRGDFLATWMHHDVEEWSLQHISFEQGQSVCSGDAPRDHYAFFIPLTRASGFRLLGQDVSEQSFAVYAPGSEHIDTTTAGCSAVVLVAPSSFAALCEKENRVLPYSGSHIMEPSTNGLKCLKELLRGLQQNLITSQQDQSFPQYRRSISDALTWALAEALPSEPASGGTPGRPKMPRAAILKQIVAILEAREGEPIYADELVKAVGISQASLQRIFHEWFGMSPARYLLLRRFYMARKRLRERRVSTVTSVALELGFWDLSRFSKTYRKIFGESPSDTLRG